jgi:hypothetical protein
MSQAVDSGFRHATYRHRPYAESHLETLKNSDTVKLQRGHTTASAEDRASVMIGIEPKCAHIDGSLRGRAKTQVALRDRLPSASVLGWQSSRLPTDYVGMAEV